MRRRAAIAGVLLVASAAFAGDIEKLVEQMGGADQAARYPAYRELLDRKDPAAVGPIVERIASWEYASQTYGVSILDTLPAKETAGAWKRLIGSSAPFVRVAAAQKIEDRERGARVIAEVVSSADIDETQLLYVLGRLYGNTDPVVQKALRTRVTVASPPSILTRALESLATSGSRETTPAVREVAAKGDEARAVIAAAWLLRFGDDEYAKPLADGLRKGVLRSGEFMYVSQWLEKADFVPAGVLDALVERLGTETEGYTLGRIANVLGAARHAGAVPALRKLLESTDSTASLGAFDALLLIPGGLDRDAVKARLTSTDPGLRVAAADALRRTDDFSGLPVVIEVLRTPGNAQRWKAAQALGDFRVDGAVEPLLEAMTCDDASTRSYAASSLANVLRTLFPYRRLDLTSVGYRYDGTDAAARTQAVEAIRKWWTEHRTRNW